MKIWIVMVEQHYANSVSLLAVCDSLAMAEQIKMESGLGDDVHIYEAEMNELYPAI